MDVAEHNGATLYWPRLRCLYRALHTGGSATDLLERWGRALAPGEATALVAERHAAPSIPAPALIEQLAPSSGEPLMARRVCLCWGGKVLSEADNWYLPSRLDAVMVAALEQDATPFGRVVRALDFWREPQRSRLLWRPRWGWDGRDLPWQVLEHQAVLYRPGRQPFSVVRETYTRELLRLGLADR